MAFESEEAGGLEPVDGDVDLREGGLPALPVQDDAATMKADRTASFPTTPSEPTSRTLGLF